MYLLTYEQTMISCIFINVNWDAATNALIIVSSWYYTNVINETLF